ncbi:MAG: M15 family metallopeptidase [Saprospiraceae bacterium]|nr:M15 family metallopeptidase [Saprospiraceae bacterium]
MYVYLFVLINLFISYNTNFFTEKISDEDLLLGKFEPTKHPNFQMIDIKYADRNGRYIQKETYKAFVAMYEAAKKEGLQLKIISATRNFEQQKKIWEDKWTGVTLIGENENLSKTTVDPVARAKRILEYSSMPGTSRHHWGTDIDINSLNDSYFQKGEGKKVYAWLQKNASKFGFCQPYTPKTKLRPNGYNEEKWHWTYTPLSSQYLTLIKNKINNQSIKGFKGAETAVSLDVVNNYILCVNTDCK